VTTLPLATRAEIRLAVREVEAEREDPKALLTRCEVARICGVDESSVRHWIERHGLPFVQVGEGGRIRIVRETLWRWIREHEGRVA